MGEPGGRSVLSLVASKNTREAAYRVLKPLRETVVQAIGDKRVVIKANVGCPQGDHRHECTDVEQLRGILDFLKPIHDQQVVMAEGAAAQACSVRLGYERYGYLPLEKEYNVKLVDSNDLPVTRTWIRAGQNFPRPIHIIDLFLDHDVYLISACRLKTSGDVIVTLSVKNVVIGAQTPSGSGSMNFAKPGRRVDIRGARRRRHARRGQPSLTCTFRAGRSAFKRLTIRVKLRNRIAP